MGSWPVCYLDIDLEEFELILLNMSLDSDITLQVGLEVAEKSLKPSPALLRICSEILQHTLPKIPRRLCGGWNSIQYILKQNKYEQFLKQIIIC